MSSSKLLRTCTTWASNCLLQRATADSLRRLDNQNQIHHKIQKHQFATKVRTATSTSPKPLNPKTTKSTTTTDPESSTTSTTTAKSESSPKKSATQVSKYLQSLPKSDVKLLTQTKLTRIRPDPGESLWLVNEEVASTIVDYSAPYVTANPNSSSVTVIEINPGLGLLTSKLRSQLGFTHINCFEGNEPFAQRLKMKQPELNLIDVNFMSFPRLHHLDKLDGGTRVANALGAVKSPSQSSTSSLYVFGATPDADFINFLIKCLVTQKVLFDEDSIPWANRAITFFLTLGSRAYTICNASSDLGFTVYRATSILFQLLFEYSCLGGVPRQGFLPWSSNIAYTRPKKAIPPPQDVEEGQGAEAAPTKPTTKKKKAPSIPHDPATMVVLQFTPNQRTIDRVGRANLFTFWFFIRHHLYARSRPVIPELERWIPGSGPRLIRKGYTIYTQFGALSPQQLLDLYLEFSSWPEFSSSSFLNAAEKYQHKVDPHEEELLNFTTKNPRF